MTGKWLLIASIGAEGLADIAAKHFQRHGAWLAWCLAGLAYSAVWILWLAAMRGGVQLGRGAVVFFVSGALLALLIGVGCYGETLTVRQWVGVVAGLLSVALVIT